jgi:transcriptional regulator with XRE-family HTH domain
MTKTFGGTIAELRRQQGISQNELAQRAGISRNSIAKWESGSRAKPSAMFIIQLANALNVQPDYLLKALETEKENTTCQEHT